MGIRESQRAGVGESHLEERKGNERRGEKELLSFFVVLCHAVLSSEFHALRRGSLGPVLVTPILSVLLKSPPSPNSHGNACG